MPIQSSSEDAGSAALWNDFNSAVLQQHLLRKHIARSRLYVVEQINEGKGGILNMTYALSLLAGSASEVDWSRPLMIGWIVIALALSVIEVFWLKGGFS